MPDVARGMEVETTTQSSSNYLRARIIILSLLSALLIAFLASIAWQASSYVILVATADEPHVVECDTPDCLPLPTSSILLLVGTIILVFGAPLFGLAADLLGRRKFVLAGALLLGIAVVGCGLVRNPLLAYADLLGATLGLAMLRPSLLAYLLQVPRSRWTLASVAGAYLAVTSLGGSVMANLAAPPGNPPWILLSGMSGLLLLIAAAIGGSLLIGLAYRLSSSHSWPQWWLEGERSRFWLLSLLAVLALAMTVNMFASALAQPPQSSKFFDLKSLNDLWAALPVIYAVSLLVGGVGADLLDWLSWRFTRRALGQVALQILGILLLYAGLGLSWSIGNWAAVRTGLVLETIGVGLVSPPIVALIAVNVRPRWWGVTLGAYFALPYLQGPLTLLRYWAEAGDFGLLFGVLYLLLAIVVVIIKVCGGRPAPVEPSQSHALENEEGLNV